MNVEIIKGITKNPQAKQLSLSYGNEEITFDVLPRKAKNSHILVKVHPNGSVEVKAPILSSEHEIIEAVKKRLRWIYKQIRTFKSQRENTIPRQYISGETHYYLGRQYQLKVLETSTTNQIKLLRGKLEVSLKHKAPKQVKQLLDNWYKQKAKVVFQRRLNMMLEKTIWVTQAPPIRIQSMKTQWGSCSPQGRLVLNPNLVKAPNDCIDYVILHELCHLEEHNHSKQFYQLLGQVMPDWEGFKTRLDGMVEQLIGE